MSTDTFRRHTRACVDAAIHRVHAKLRDRPFRLGFFERLLDAARRSSDLMAHPPARGGVVVQVEALRNMVWFERALVRDPEEWPGATGHPLRVVHSLADHLFGYYPAPRFLASVWFGKSSPMHTERRHWYVAVARGRSLRSLPLPIALTRRMAHVLLCTPDHVGFERALRRAEVLGLGGTPELVEAILGTRIAERFDDGERWRAALAWLVGCGDTVDLAQVGPVVDFLDANRISLRGRTFRSVLRLIAEWHERLQQQQRRAIVHIWSRSAWRELHAGEWSIVELTDGVQLAVEGREMRHCVRSYARRCARGWSSIWSLRYRGTDDEVARPVLTIEVDPRHGTIVQVRGKANALAGGAALEVVRRWARREDLRFADGVSFAGLAPAVHR